MIQHKTPSPNAVLYSPVATYESLLKLMVILGFALGCEDLSPLSIEKDQGAELSDQSPSLDLQIGSDQGGLEESSFDQELTDQELTDQELTDQSVSLDSMDGAVPMPPTDMTARYLLLSVTEAELAGEYTWLDNQRILLDAGATVSWEIDSSVIPLEAIITLMVRGQVWRFEDGEISVKLNEQERLSQVWGDGRFDFHVARVPYQEWDLESRAYRTEDRERLFGNSAPPPVFSWSITSPITELTLRSRGGGLVLSEVLIRGAQAVDLEPSLDEQEEENELEVEVIPYSSCSSEPSCDDGTSLQRVIDEASPGPLVIELLSQHYQATNPVVIRRPQVEIKGRGEPTTWRWSPQVGIGQSWAFQFRGGGVGGSNLIISEAVSAGQRRVRVAGEVSSASEWVRLSADDFGEVPPVCINGRDVERQQRHQRQLFRVLEINVEADSTLLTLDRAINLDLPLEARPALSFVELLTDVQLTNIHLQADCPESITNGYRQASCANPEVIDDGGVLGLFTSGLKLTDLSATGFGKFTYEIRDSLESVVSDCQMSYPSAYGSGGQGYGVHLIGASRTMIIDLEVERARHGVVIDFGSSDSQVLGGRFSHMNQALLDVHGEASRDTLIRGVILAESSLGVIIGGGGRTVHCNDGLRHHVQLSQISECGIGISVSDYTEFGFIRSNTLSENGTHLAAVFGARHIIAERNDFGEAQLKPFSLSHEDTTDLLLKHNYITGHCAPQESTILFVGAAEPLFENNLWCLEE